MPELTIKQVAAMGGNTIKEKYGNDYFKQLQAKRKIKRGKNSSKLPIDNG